MEFNSRSRIALLINSESMVFSFRRLGEMPKLSAKSGKEGDMKETKRLSWDRNKMSLQ
jgi:hypothetical protein